MLPINEAKSVLNKSNGFGLIMKMSFKGKENFLRADYIGKNCHKAPTKFWTLVLCFLLSAQLTDEIDLN